MIDYIGSANSIENLFTGKKFTEIKNHISKFSDGEPFGIYERSFEIFGTAIDMKITPTKSFEQAVKTNDFVKAREAVKDGAEINNFFSDACFYGDLQKIKFAIDAGIDLSTNVRNILFWQFFFNRLELAKYLVEIGIDWKDTPGLERFKTKEEVLQYLELLLL